MMPAGPADMTAGAAPVRLEAEALCIGHGRRVVAQDMAFSLDAGEVVVLLGPNGGGKTTLFRTLLGLLPALGGRLVLDGRALTQWTRREIARRLGYVPQGHAALFPYTALETVLMGRAAHLSPLAQPARADREIAQRSLARMGVEHLAHRSVSEISGGERQLVLIARALAQEPGLLVMDEPTASLDFGNQQRVLDQIRGLRDQGMAILVSTHQPEHALAVADRIALLHEGRLIGPGPVAEVATPQRLANLYGVTVQQVLDRLPGSPWGAAE